MITEIVVVIPAADEDQFIGACLRAVARARAHVAQRPVSVRTVVVLDSCTDRTAEVVAGFGDVEAVVVAHRCVGRARRDGAAFALAPTTEPTHDLAQTWLANTDADSQVPVDWLLAMVDAADAGADVVVGTVRPGAGLTAAVGRLWTARHDRRDGHAHVHGANLGIRASTYLDLGGWAPLSEHEDAALVALADDDGAITVLRTATAPVITSARSANRVPVGFAGYLALLAAEVDS